MANIETPNAGGEDLSCWLCEPYGAPCETSEIRRIEAFYKAESLTVCGHTICAATVAPAERPPARPAAD
jgi:hypothetical protein